MNLLYLKYFYDTFLSGSVTDAARRNFVSQPAISKAIKNLESDLGVLLFHHKKQKFKPTPEGELVFEQSKDIFSAVRRLKDSLDRYHKKPKMPLHFVTTQSIGLSFFPELIPAFRESYPEIEIHFLFGGLSQMKGWLKLGISEFGLVFQSPDIEGYQEKLLYQGEFRMYRHINEIRSLESAGCYVEHKDGFLVSEYLQKMDQPWSIAAELNSWELIAKTIDLHGGYGLIPDIVAKKYPNLIPLSIHLPYSICAIWPKGETLSYSAQQFLEFFSNIRAIQETTDPGGKF